MVASTMREWLPVAGEYLKAFGRQTAFGQGNRSFLMAILCLFME